MAMNGACPSEYEYMLRYCSGTCKEDAFSMLDKSEKCPEAAKNHQCLTNSHNMWRECPETCKNTKGIRKLEVARIYDGSFFDLEAKKADGSILDFQDLDNHITVLVNVAILQDANKTKKFFEELETLNTMFVRTVKILAFPFEVTGNAEECKALSSDIIHIMEEAQLNGPDTHPVYRYLKKLFNVTDFETLFPTFFMVNSEGNYVESHQGGDPGHMTTFLRQRSKMEFDLDNKHYLV
eukprot:CAMPEP_0171306438 /NCGR_PEP_ID=MMETSP0816-20121228/16449_1 /TAXON_ID=420281 /ORGANISM="Proboscia inermis, Strain CCAP1064/1" /LENGTH=236 /DNA_ID=CAMNT_0011788013 /DNA_START=25 /DNA_END=735 /DNA_ORIENTATION=+